MKTCAVIVLLLVGGAGPLGAQTLTGTVVGTIADAETGEVLVGVNVLVKGTVLGTASGRDGSFSITNLRPGTYQFEFSIVGYTRHMVPVTVAVGDTTRLDVRLTSTAIPIDQIVITATRREMSIEEAPVSVATVTADELAFRKTITLDDALRYVPGVNMLQDQVNIRGSSGYSRGVGSRVLLLFDGLPYLTGDTGEIIWEVIPVHEIEKIEVVKGAGSALYGSSALGGVINVITKDLRSGSKVHYKFYGGLYDQPAYDEWKWSDGPRGKAGAIVDVSQKNGPFGYLVSIARSIDDSYRSTDAYHRWSVFTKLQYDFSATQRITFTGNVMNRVHENYFWWESLEKPLLVYPAQVNGRVRSTRGNASFDYREFVSDRFFYTVKGIYYGNAWKDDSAGVVINDSKSNLAHAEVQFTYQIAQDNFLTWGVTGAIDQVRSNLFSNQRGTRIAAYVQDELAVTRAARLTAGIRYDRGKVSGIDPAGRISPTVGATVSLTKQWTARASLGTGFRYPSIAELHISSPANVTGIAVVPNLALKPERSVTGEVGITGLAGDVGQLDFALFQNQMRDLIEPTVFVAGEPYIQFRNVTRARIQGFETGLRTGVPDLALGLNFGYTYVWAREIDSTGGELPLKFRPRHLVIAGLNWTRDNLRVGLEYRFTSRIERVDENLSQIIPDGEARVAIHVVDLRFSYDLSHTGLPLTIGLDVSNLLNYYYVELTGNMAPLRTYLISLEGSL